MARSSWKHKYPQNPVSANAQIEEDDDDDDDEDDKDDDDEEEEDDDDDDDGVFVVLIIVGSLARFNSMGSPVKNNSLLLISLSASSS